MLRNISFAFICSIGSLFVLGGCRKIIQLNLPSGSRSVIIEASLSDSAGQAYVHLSHSVRLDETEDKPIRDASVTMTEEGGQQFSFTEKTPGDYRCDRAKGQAGKTYTLHVRIGNQHYEAKEKMPTQKIVLDKLEEVKPHSPNILVAPLTDKQQKNVSLLAGFQNLRTSRTYAVLLVRKNQEISEAVLHKQNTIPPRMDTAKVHLRINEVTVGQEVSVDLQCISEEMYNLLFHIEQNALQRNSTPTSPPTNISNGALGYFKVHTSSLRKLTIR